VSLRNVAHKAKRKKRNWIGHILHRNCLLILVFESYEGKLKARGRRERRRKQLLVDLKEKIRQWNLLEETLDGTVLIIGFGYGPVARHAVYVGMYVCMYVCMFVCMYVCMYVCVYVCMYVVIYVCMYMCMYVFMYVCVCVCMYYVVIYVCM